VRINPDELHISTPEFHDKIYVSGGKRREKWERFVRQFDLPLSAFGTTDHDAHRIRRAAMSPAFSKAAVRRLQPVIDERLGALLGRISDHKDSGSIMTLNVAFSAFTAGN
jgi:cytochrome P450